MRKEGERNEEPRFVAMIERGPAELDFMLSHLRSETVPFVIAHLLAGSDGLHASQSGIVRESRQLEVTLPEVLTHDELLNWREMNPGHCQNVFRIEVDPIPMAPYRRFTALYHPASRKGFIYRTGSEEPEKD